MLLCSAVSRWRFGRWRLRRSFNSADLLLGCSSDWGRRVSYSTSGQPLVAATLMAHSWRSFNRWYTLKLLRSALSWFLGRCYFAYQHSSPDAVDWADGASANFWQAIVGYPFGSPLNSRPSLPWLYYCSGRAVLAPVRPMLPSLALSAALSAGGIFGSGALRRSLSRPVVSFIGAIHRALGRWCLRQWRSTAFS